MKNKNKVIFLCGCYATCLKCLEKVAVPRGTRLNYNPKLKDYETVCKECTKK
tara:strand:+ start:111 stop:266 length:156 start_codon:yes stop_codon:yes gene_type:complete